jgi:signal peptidase
MVIAAATGKEIEITSSGDSMFPLIKDGNVCIFTKVVSPSDLFKGDIILFSNTDGVLIGHRFYYKDGYKNYHFKGDTNQTFDIPVAYDQVIYKLKAIRKGRFLLRTSGWVCRSWGLLIMHVPLLTKLLRRYLRQRSLSRLHRF